MRGKRGRRRDTRGPYDSGRNASQYRFPPVKSYLSFSSGCFIFANLIIHFTVPECRSFPRPHALKVLICQLSFINYSPLPRAKWLYPGCALCGLPSRSLPPPRLWGVPLLLCNSNSSIYILDSGLPDADAAPLFEVNTRYRKLIHYSRLIPGRAPPRTRRGRGRRAIFTVKNTVRLYIRIKVVGIYRISR